MALTPMLIIGCGGSGGKVVLNLRRRLDEELKRRGWNEGVPKAWQLKWIDVPENPEEYPQFGPPLPLGDYLGLAPVTTYGLVDTALGTAAGGNNRDRLVGWRPSPHLMLPVHKGAGQMRAVGRAVALANSAPIRQTIDQALTQIDGGVAELTNLAGRLGVEGGADHIPVVFVVTSMAGGTGAGIFMDVCDVVRAVRPSLTNQIFGLMFTAEIFKGVDGDGGMAPNTTAALSEMMCGFLSAERPVEPLFGKMSAVDAVGKSGPSWPYVIGMKPLKGGPPLESPAQCYRAVTETLVATALNDKFTQAFVGHEITNFERNSDASKRLVKYQMFNQPRVLGEANIPCGVVSSFGSALVSVGSARFAEWARDRLARAVVDHVVDGWRDYGRQLMGDLATPATTDRDVVDFLVARERNRYLEACGLWEEDEPNGTVEHNQVLDGILTMDALINAREQFRGGLLAELVKAGSLPGATWAQRIEALVENRRSNFQGEVLKLLEEGTGSYGAEVVGKVSAAVSTWISRFGIPVTRGLTEELIVQCRTAISQLTASANTSKTTASGTVSQYVFAAFDRLGKSSCKGDSDYVREGVGQALGPLSYSALQRRYEYAAEFLGNVVTRVLQPLLKQLDDVAARLSDEATVKQVSEWPDSAGVGPIYAPSPSEKVLVQPAEWDTYYQQLLTESAGSITAARDQIAAGGFTYGPIVQQATAPSMISLAGTPRWWERDSGVVGFEIHLRPTEITQRTTMWLWNENHSMGKFVRTGLSEFLGEVGTQRAKRLERFREALTSARQLAQPLIAIDPVLMSRVHPGYEGIESTIRCEQFPFTSANADAQDIVAAVMHGEREPDGGWFMTSNANGVESVLLTAVLNSAVQPSVVTSVVSPIAAAWSKVVAHSTDSRQGAIGGFWAYNRARLLSEAIPLTASARDSIVRGWFVGRLLGLVTNPSSTTAMQVLYTDHNKRAQSAALPWPLLRHAVIGELHAPTYRVELLPAILEHLGLAMMLLGHDPGILEGYEQLFRLGTEGSVSSVLNNWIVDGLLPVSSGAVPQVSGGSAEERKASLEHALGELTKQYKKRSVEGMIELDWSEFVKIPFGFELNEIILEVLAKLTAAVQTIDLSASEFG